MSRIKNELKQQRIKTVIEMAEFLKFKESQKKWNEINESGTEYITVEEQTQLKEVKVNGEFIDRDDLLKEFRIAGCCNYSNLYI
ncbi:MAG: hypothetical protein N3B21_08870 [Clostridia bacterium]|nr:hypothetical protein [Clostridia bacterium]